MHIPRGFDPCCPRAAQVRIASTTVLGDKEVDAAMKQLNPDDYTIPPKALDVLR